MPKRKRNVSATAPAYSEDLAYIHHVGFGDFARQAAPGVLNMLREHGIADGLVVDLGCGSGIWAKELCQAGYQVLGIDVSPAMIELARSVAPAATFTVGSLLRVPLPACVAVTSLSECVNYLFDKSNSLRALAPLFRRVFKALRQGGIFVFDAIGPGVIREPGGVRQGFRKGDDWAVFARSTEQAPLLTRDITSFRRRGKHYRRSDEVHRVRLYQSSDVAQQLAAAGFDVRVLNSYGAFALQPAHAAFLASKPAK